MSKSGFRPPTLKDKAKWYGCDYNYDYISYKLFNNYNKYKNVCCDVVSHINKVNQLTLKMEII